MRKMTKADMPTSWGIFSPTGHVVMAFATDADANKASAALRSAGVAGDSILHYSPAEVLDLIKPTEDSDEKAFQLGQETEKVDRYAALAKKGSGFLVVYAPKDEESKRVVDMARPFQL